jgi:anti-anti-sigma factor
MSEQLTISEEKTENHLVLVLNGRLDAYWSAILGEKMESCLHEGFYDLLLDTSGITYMSSAGIRILFQYFKKLREIQGSLQVVRPSEQVRSVLEMAGMKMLMKAKEGRKTESGPHPVSESCIDQVRYIMETIYPDESLKGMTVGSPTDLFDGMPDPASVRTIPFHSQQYGIGIGAFGDGQEELVHRMGEFIGLGDVIACLPTDERKKPDYLIRTGQMVPKVNLLYGLLFEGLFSHMIRFEVTDMNRKVRFSQLMDHLRQLVPFERAGMVMVAESSGLVGVSLAADPTDREQADPLFSFPAIKQQVTVTTEPEFSGMLALVTGVVSAAETDKTNRHLRPLAQSSPLLGHFHAAVFSYHPLKKHWKDPREVIKTLVEEHQFETILHLLNDQRSHLGIGESELRAGTCWVGEISTMNITS